MALSQETLDAIRAAVVAGIAEVAQARSAPVSTGEAAAPVHIGPSGKPDGRKYACAECGRMFRSTGLKPGARGGLEYHRRESGHKVA